MTAFDDFWSASPRKLDKVLAKARFDALTSKDGLTTRIRDRESGQLIDVHYDQVSPEILVNAMKKYAKEQMDPKTFGYKDDGKYLIHPATFLNRGRWLDYDFTNEGENVVRLSKSLAS